VRGQDAHARVSILVSGLVSVVTRGLIAVVIPA
jgi:hypothetical protein